MTIEEKVKAVFGEQTLQLCMAQVQIEDLKNQIGALQKELEAGLKDGTPLAQPTS